MYWNEPPFTRARHTRRYCNDRDYNALIANPLLQLLRQVDTGVSFSCRSRYSLFVQPALQDWYPLVPLFRRLGVRTAREIARERADLKALRRDFDRLLSCETDDTSARADAVLRAVGQ